MTESKRFCLFLFPSALIQKVYSQDITISAVQIVSPSFGKYTGEASSTCWSYMTLGSVFNTTSHLFAVFTFTHIFKLISLNWWFQCEHLDIFHFVSALGMLHKVQQRQNNFEIFITSFRIFPYFQSYRRWQWNDTHTVIKLFSIKQHSFFIVKWVILL